MERQRLAMMLQHSVPVATPRRESAEEFATRRREALARFEAAMVQHAQSVYFAEEGGIPALVHDDLAPNLRKRRRQRPAELSAEVQSRLAETLRQPPVWTPEWQAVPREGMTRRRRLPASSLQYELSSGTRSVAYMPPLACRRPVVRDKLAEAEYYESETVAPSERLLAALRAEAIAVARGGLDVLSGRWETFDRAHATEASAVLCLSEGCHQGVPTGNEARLVVEAATEGVAAATAAAAAAAEEEAGCAPRLVVGFDGEWISVPPQVLPKWEFAHLEPVSSMEATCEYGVLHVLGEKATEGSVAAHADRFLREVSALFDVCNLGSLVRKETGDGGQRPIAALPLETLLERDLGKVREAVQPLVESCWPSGLPSKPVAEQQAAIGQPQQHQSRRAAAAAAAAAAADTRKDREKLCVVFVMLPAWTEPYALVVLDALTRASATLAQRLVFQLVPQQLAGQVLRRRAMQKLACGLHVKTALAAGRVSEPLVMVEHPGPACVHVAYWRGGPGRRWLAVCWTDQRGSLLDAWVGEARGVELGALLNERLWKRTMELAQGALCLCALHDVCAKEQSALEALAAGTLPDQTSFALCQVRGATIKLPPQEPPVQVRAASAGSEVLLGCLPLESDPQRLPVLEVKRLAGGLEVDNILRDLQLLAVVGLASKAGVVPIHVEALARLAATLPQLSS